MKLKRLYKTDPAAAAPPVGDEERLRLRRAAGRGEIGAAESARALGLVPAGVAVLSAPARQTFSTRLVEAGVAEGWLTLGQGRIVVHASNGDVAYRIVRGPGHYCCHCGEPLPDAAQAAPGGGTLGHRHVRERHAGVASPDANNPAGYRRLNGYEGELVSPLPGPSNSESTHSVGRAGKREEGEV